MQKNIVKTSPGVVWPPDAGIRGWDETDGSSRPRRHDPKTGELWPPDGQEHITSGSHTGALRKKA